MGDNLGASDIETVTVQLAGLLLTISVSPLPSGDSPPESQTWYSTSRVARAVAGPAPTTDLTPELRALVLETTSPLALAALPVPLLDLKAPLLRSQHSVWTGRARLGRAFRAGIIAKIRLDGDSCELSSPSIPQRNAFYICLRCSRYPRGFWSASYQSYIELIGTRGSTGLESGSISHAFPSKVEAEVYAAGANQPWPVEV